MRLLYVFTLVFEDGGWATKEKMAIAIFSFVRSCKALLIFCVQLEVRCAYPSRASVTAARYGFLLGEMGVSRLILPFYYIICSFILKFHVYLHTETNF